MTLTRLKINCFLYIMRGINWYKNTFLFTRLHLHHISDFNTITIEWIINMTTWQHRRRRRIFYYYTPQWLNPDSKCWMLILTIDTLINWMRADALLYITTSVVDIIDREMNKKNPVTKHGVRKYAVPTGSHYAAYTCSDARHKTINYKT